METRGRNHRQGLFVAAALRFLPSVQTWKVGGKNQFCENARNGAAGAASSLTI
jgi:hypothetical protein